jgi:hypothetical protein
MSVMCLDRLTYDLIYADAVASQIEHGLDLKAARDMAQYYMGRAFRCDDADETQDSYDRLKEEHGLADTDMHHWFNRPQSGGQP